MRFIGHACKSSLLVERFTNECGHVAYAVSLRQFYAG
jgi:hypothetical protein